VLVVALVALLLGTPAVGDAEQRAASLDRAHHAAPPTSAVPARFAAALLATEDSRFYLTPGIDPISIARASLVALTSAAESGAATVEQQLAKQLYTGGRSSGLGLKAEQVALAIKLDTTYSKPEILRMYAAVVYFGHGYWGLAAASHGYFHRPPDHLTWGQAALLAGLVQAPSADDPLTHPARARARQTHVLHRLVTIGILTRAAAQAAARLDHRRAPASAHPPPAPRLAAHDAVAYFLPPGGGFHRAAATPALTAGSPGRSTPTAR
jgi:penicillin-binding protein 1A